MSEYVDDLLAECGYPPDGWEQPSPEDYASLPEKDLRKECAKARNPKIVSIRDYPHPLTKQQIWCLAHWCIQRDQRAAKKTFHPFQ